MFTSRMLLAFIFAWVLPQAASAAEWVRKVDFGNPGDIATYGAANFDYSRSQPGTYDAVCNAKFAPGVLYFISEKLAVGAAVQSGYSSRNNSWSQVVDYSVGVVPKISYKLTLTDELTLLPEVSVGIINGWENRENSLDASFNSRLNNGSQVTATFYVPLLVKPAGSHRSGLTPTFQWDLMSRFAFSNGANGGTTPGPSIMPAGWPSISCQSTLGIHF